MNVRKYIIAISLLLASLATTSCATFANQISPLTNSNAEIVKGESNKGNTCTSPWHIYGGTITDGTIMVATSASLVIQPLSAIVAIPVFVISTIDLPLSFVADTVLLPVTVTRQIDQCSQYKKRELPDDAVTTISAFYKGAQ